MTLLALGYMPHDKFHDETTLPLLPFVYFTVPLGYDASCPYNAYNPMHESGVSRSLPRDLFDSLFPLSVDDTVHLLNHVSYSHKSRLCFSRNRLICNPCRSSAFRSISIL